MCAGCRELRNCIDPTDPPASELIKSRHALAAQVPVNDGVYEGVPDTVYHADPHSLSSSGARTLLNKTPAEFLEDRNTPPKPKPQYDFGHAAHRMVLGAGSDIAVMDPAIHGKTADGKLAQEPKRTTMWKKAEEKFRDAGKTCITKEQMGIAQVMAGRVWSHPVAAKLLSEGTAEASGYWHDDATGARLRVRFDFLPDRPGGRQIVVDYKTAISANPAAFRKSCGDYGYHQQAAWYIDSVPELQIGEDAAFVFLVQMKTPPFLVSVVQLDPDAIELGRRLNRKAIDRFAECMTTDKWPGHGDGIHTVSLPPWVHTQAEAVLSA